MKKTRYTETQIIKILKEVEGSRMVKEVCREYGISDATYYNWKSKYGGMTASDVKKLKELENENRRLNFRVGCAPCKGGVFQCVGGTPGDFAPAGSNRSRAG